MEVPTGYRGPKLRQVGDTEVKYFCGPTALSALSGVRVEEVCRMVRQLQVERGKHLRRDGKIRGMTKTEARMTALKLFQNVNLWRSWGVSLTQFVDKVSDGCYLVNVTGHYIALEKFNGHVYIADTANREGSTFGRRRGNPGRTGARKKVQFSMKVDGSVIDKER